MHEKTLKLYSIQENSGTPSVKKQGNDFDVTKKAYDGAEISEPIDIFMVSLLQNNTKSMILKTSD